MIKSFEDYQVENEQLFETKAAFNAAVRMCKEHYEATTIPLNITEGESGILTTEDDEIPEVVTDENFEELLLKSVKQISEGKVKESGVVTLKEPKKKTKKRVKSND